jgi:hypothetical protein
MRVVSPSSGKEEQRISHTLVKGRKRATATADGRCGEEKHAAIKKDAGGAAILAPMPLYANEERHPVLTHSEFERLLIELAKEGRDRIDEVITSLFRDEISRKVSLTWGGHFLQQ